MELLSNAHFARLATLVEAEKKLMKDKHDEANMFRKVFLDELKSRLDGHRGEKIVIDISGTNKVDLSSDTRRNRDFHDVPVMYTFIGKIPKDRPAINEDFDFEKRYLSGPHLEVSLDEVHMRYGRNNEFVRTNEKIYLESNSNIGKATWNLDEVIRTSIQDEHWKYFFDKNKYRDVRITIHIGNVEFAGWLSMQDKKSKVSLVLW